MQVVGEILPTEEYPYLIRLGWINKRVAAEYLESNHPLNRHGKYRNSNKISVDMTNGNFLFSAETIKFDEDGYLIDGQNRLAAIIKADANVLMLVCWSLNPRVIEVIDSGLKRTAADFLKMSGEQNYCGLAALLHLLYRWIKCGNTFPKRVDQIASNAVLKELLKEHPDLRESVAYTHKFAGPMRRVMTPTVAAFAHYILAQINKERANYFMQALCTGGNLSTDNPIYLARERMFAFNLKQVTYRDYEYLAVIFYAWNAYMTGRKPKMIKQWTISDPFPVPVTRAKEDFNGRR